MLMLLYDTCRTKERILCIVLLAISPKDEPNPLLWIAVLDLMV